MLEEMANVCIFFVASNVDLSTMEETLPWTAPNSLLNPPQAPEREVPLPTIIITMWISFKDIRILHIYKVHVAQLSNSVLFRKQEVKYTFDGFWQKKYIFFLFPNKFLIFLFCPQNTPLGVFSSSSHCQTLILLTGIRT